MILIELLGLTWLGSAHGCVAWHVIKVETIFKPKMKSNGHEKDDVDCFTDLSHSLDEKSIRLI